MALPVTFPYKPSLQWVIKPESNHRFRYANSDTGSHGVIQGDNYEKANKTYPTVKLENYSGSSSNIIIKVSLCTEYGAEHVHQFKFKQKNFSKEQKKSLQKSSELRSNIERTLNDDFCAVFEDLSIVIIGTQKKGHEILMKRRIENLREGLSETDKEKYEKEHIKEVKEEYSKILHSVVLRFDAFKKGNQDVPICEPLYSDAIRNDKVLKICDMSKYSGSWKGGEDIILLCEGIKKNVEIKFFETDVEQNLLEEYASINPSNIHHQVAIKFKTPPYKANIEKIVAVCLKQKNEISEPQYFTYIPEEVPHNGDLKICHMSKSSGSWRGDEDVILLCENVQKENVKIKFFEADDNENRWEAYALFSISDIHHEVAIKFKTPQYKANIEKDVFVCLEQGDESSTPRSFTYRSEDCPLKRKKCVPKETVNLISNPMEIASSSCTSDEMLNEILKEQPKALLESLGEICKNGENLSSFTIEDSEIPSSALDPESRENFQLSFLMDLLLSDNGDEEDDSVKQPANELEDQNVNQSYPFLINPDDMDGVMIDGNLARKIALISIEDSEFSVEIPKEVSKKESKNKMLKDKHKFEQFLPFLSNRDNDGNSLLHLAVLYIKSIKKVLYMNEMSKSNIINVKNNKEQTALHIAVEHNSDVVIELLENLADPNIKNAGGNNCYHIACRHDFSKCLMYMCKKSRYNTVGLNDFNNEGQTPVHVALKNYSPASLDFLLKKCRHLIDFSLVESNLGKSFLHYAVEYSPTYVLPLLKEKKIEVNIKDFEGRTPLLIARVKGNYDVVNQLLSAGAVTQEEGFFFHRKKQALLREREASIKQACLNKASKGPQDSNDSNKDKESARIFEELAKNLSVLLDPDMKWRELATYVIDEEFFSSIVEYTSPTRTILECMKKNYGAQYIEQLILVLDAIGFSDAVKVTTESCQTFL